MCMLYMCMCMSRGCDGGSGVTGMWVPERPKKRGRGYRGGPIEVDRSFCAILTYTKSCHVNRELSRYFTKRSREMRCE